MAQDEIFRTIEGFEQYQISNLGRIVSNKYGKSKFLKAQKDAIGYFHVRLFPKDPIYGFYANGRGMIPKLEKIHRLVADAFIPKPEGDYVLQVNHKDGNKENNAVTNLEWVTAEENIKHSWEIGLRDNSAWKAAVHRRKPVKAIHPDGTEEYFLSRIHAAISNGINPPVVFNSIHNNRPIMRGAAKGIQFFDTESLPEGKMWREIANIEQMLLEYREKFYGKYQKAYRKKWYAKYKANKKKNNEKN